MGWAWLGRASGCGGVRGWWQAGHWAGGRARVPSCCSSCIYCFHLFSFHQLYRGVRGSSQCPSSFSHSLLDLEKLRFLCANPPLHQHSQVTDSESAHLEDWSASRGRERQRYWCCSIPQPAPCERGSPQGTDESHSRMGVIWCGAGKAAWCWLSPELPVPRATSSFCWPVHVHAGSSEAEFTHDTNKLFLTCCCAVNDSCWVLMIKVNCIFSFLLPS